MDTICKIIEIFVDRLGKATSLLVLPLLGVVFYEVIMRYVFNAPTVWGFELTLFFYGLNFMLGLAFTLGVDGHVKVDVLTAKMQPRRRALMNIIGYGVIFMPVWVIMSWASVKYALTSTLQHELNSTSWAPPIWPFKILMAVAFIALTLQGLVELWRNVETYRELGK